VLVKDARDFTAPAVSASPVPFVIAHLLPFPKARELRVSSKLGGAAGRLLADKMPSRVRRMDILSVPGAEAVAVLGALGRERQVENVYMGEAVDLTQLAQSAASFPAILAVTGASVLSFTTKVPDTVEDAGGYILTGLSYRIQHMTGRGRGLHGMELRVEPSTVAASVQARVPDGARIGHFVVSSKQWRTRTLAMTLYSTL